ncbi:hypothetical protein [Vibrio parahaemolyticus]|uniref:hypothetical protein n=1 Tax=Vibrio parahaemolyticus TaxID=670 RepID=UPI001C576191|nr:hypothetical protein [Vibrio parahaemolyticus]
MAAIEVRLMVTGASTLNPLPKPDCYAPFVPYEWNLPVVVCVRATGGNAGNALAGQATWINMQLANFLENELVEVRDVGQILKVPKGMMQLGPKKQDAYCWGCGNHQCQIYPKWLHWRQRRGQISIPLMVPLLIVKTGA